MATANNTVTKAEAEAGDTGTSSPAPARIDAAVAKVKAGPKKAKALTRKARAAAKASARKAPAPNTASPNSKLKDTTMADTQTTDFAASMKAAAADAQTRAKAAFDTFQGFAGDMTEMTKGNVEALVESGKILGAGVQDFARSEVEAARNAFEALTADLKAMVAVKNPAELFKLQGEIARRNFDAVVARASKNAEVSMKLANDAFAPISNRMSIAADKISKAA